MVSITDLHQPIRLDITYADAIHIMSGLACFAEKHAGAELYVGVFNELYERVMRQTTDCRMTNIGMGAKS
jgi:hypothetical protein